MQDTAVEHYLQNAMRVAIEREGLDNTLRTVGEYMKLLYMREGKILEIYLGTPETILEK
jgi:hypothetical protein